MPEIDPMNDDDRDFDPQLHALFAREHTHVAAEAFVTRALRAIAAERTRALWTNRVLQGVGVIALIALSPVLIGVSRRAAMRLVELAAIASAWPAAPFVLASVALLALAAIATKWARIW
jgi:hypothetical protein